MTRHTSTVCPPSGGTGRRQAAQGGSSNTTRVEFTPSRRFGGTS